MQNKKNYKTNKRPVLLVGERSAGHIFAALAIASALTAEEAGRPAVPVYVFATSRSLRQYVLAQDLAVVGKSFAWRNLILECVWRFFEALYLLIRLRPQLVIGFGGRDSFFLVLLSTLLPIKTVIYEPNVTFGRANKFLAHTVDAIWRGLGCEAGNAKTEIVGVPLRKNIKKIPQAEARRELGLDREPVILCFGGSQGSSFLNKVFMRYAAESKERFSIIHISGREESLKIEEFYNKIGRKNLVRDFCYNIELFYSAADLVVSRAGALTVGEIVFYRLPSILVPHPSAYGHQKSNAIFLVDKKAAFMHEQSESFYEGFAECLRKLITDQALREKISKNLGSLRGGVLFEDFSSKFNKCYLPSLFLKCRR